MARRVRSGYLGNQAARLLEVIFLAIPALAVGQIRLKVALDKTVISIKALL